jgi:hypothetical protein
MEENLSRSSCEARLFSSARDERDCGLPWILRVLSDSNGTVQGDYILDGPSPDESWQAVGEVRKIHRWGRFVKLGRLRARVFKVKF